jgi:hypothetical protein
MVHDLFPLSLGSVEGSCHRLLAIRMVARDIEELPRGSERAMPEAMDEGGAGRAVLERRDGLVVRRAGKLGTSLGEAPDVLAQALPWLLLAVAHLPLLAGVGVHALEVSDENPT